MSGKIQPNEQTPVNLPIPGSPAGSIGGKEAVVLAKGFGLDQFFQTLLNKISEIWNRKWLSNEIRYDMALNASIILPIVIIGTSTALFGPVGFAGSCVPAFVIGALAWAIIRPSELEN